MITASSASTLESSVQNERLADFLQILFAKPSYDSNGELSKLIPATLSDDLQEVITATPKTSEQTQIISDSIEVLADNVKKERNYLSRASSYPFLSNDLIIYAIQAQYYSDAIDANLELLKK